MANKAGNTHRDLDAATVAFGRANLVDPIPTHPLLTQSSTSSSSSALRGGRGGLRRNRPGALIDIDPSLALPSVAPGGPSAAGLGPGRPPLGGEGSKRMGDIASPFSNFSKIVLVFSQSSPPHDSHLSSDPSGVLKFNGKAIVHSSGVDFSNGASFSISMDQFQLDEELGKGNYGIVKKVLHRPHNVIMAMKVSLDQDDHHITLNVPIGNPPRTRRS